MRIVERIKSPTPKFFKIFRSFSLFLLAIEGTIVAPPIVLPVTVVTVASYIVVAKGVISAVNQMSVSEENQKKPRDRD